MKRFIVSFVTVCICFCLATPFVTANASSANSVTDAVVNDNWVDLMPFLSCDDSLILNSNNYGRFNFIFSTAPYSNYKYVDVLFQTNSTNFTVSTNAGSLTVVNVSGSLYRAYGVMFSNDAYLTTHPYVSFYLYNGSFFQLLSCKSSVRFTEPVAIPYSYSLVTPYNTSSGTFSVGSTNASCSFDSNVPDSISNLTGLSFYANMSLSVSDQVKFDSLIFSISLPCNNINSIRVHQGDIPLSFTHNTFNDSNDSTSNRTRYLYITVDLSNLNRTLSSPVSVYIDGTFTYGKGALVYFQDAYGYISIESNPIQYWIAAHTASVKSYFNTLTSNLSNWFSTNFTWLSNILDELKKLNGDDSEAVQAIQTQEEINVSVNNQLVGAVEDWNTNIEVVQTGYDSAVTKATPALGWLASLADRIFTNMGWFGNIYFLVGLISVIMLVLSKSGLARSVSRFRRNE